VHRCPPARHRAPSATRRKGLPSARLTDEFSPPRSRLDRLCDRREDIRNGCGDRHRLPRRAHGKNPRARHRAPRRGDGDMGGVLDCRRVCLAARLGSICARSPRRGPVRDQATVGKIVAVPEIKDIRNFPRPFRSRGIGVIVVCRCASRRALTTICRCVSTAIPQAEELAQSVYHR
jgi:hypothetical protein